MLIDKTDLMEEYFQLYLTFETVDSMGANFINSCLEQIAKELKSAALEYDYFNEEEKQIEIVMSILSNYVPGCIVHASVSCPVEELEEAKGLSSEAFAKKFIRAVQVAQKEPYRAVTHNKGIMNGIDAVVIATGNDFRAVEAAAHAYAAKEGSYTSLSNAYIENNNFFFEIKLPLSLGTCLLYTSPSPRD